MQAKPLPAEDLQTVVEQAQSSFAALREARIFVTGGTGFFGHWLLESLLAANRELGINTQATVLTRSVEKIPQRLPLDLERQRHHAPRRRHPHLRLAC